MTDTETPRTNRVTRHTSEIASGLVVPADVAEQIERELTAAKARIAELEGALREVVEMWEEYSAGSDIGIAGTAYAMRSAARRALERRLA